MFDNKHNRRHLTLAALLVLASVQGTAWADQYEEAAKKWIGSEFKPSTLTPEQQLAELQWFIKAAEPFRGMKINVVSETITTHEYESKVLAKAFSEITGIQLTHDLLQEGDVVEKLQTQMQSDKNIYDGWVNDSDLIGTHFRYGKVESITDLMANEGKAYTSPTLDLKDFIGISFTTAPDGKVYQLPDQQFANLYWFRADWFERPELKARFKEKYGYEMSLFRPPMGEFSVRSLALAQSLGYQSVFWSFAYLDYDVNNQPEPTAALARVTGAAHGGGIFLLHAVSKTNTEILGSVIDDFRSKGFTVAKYSAG